MKNTNKNKREPSITDKLMFTLALTYMLVSFVVLVGASIAYCFV